MGRPKGSRNKRTLLRQAEEALARTRDPNEIVDMLHVIETAASQFFLRAVAGENAARDPSQVDADYQRAAHLAALALPYPR
jgi:HEAT repeat protein